MFGHFTTLCMKGLSIKDSKMREKYAVATKAARKSSIKCKVPDRFEQS